MEPDDDGVLHDALIGRARKAIDEAHETVEDSDVLAHLTASGVDAGLVSRCAWCGRYRVGERWVDAGRGSALPQWSRATHGICPDCLDDLRRSGKSV